MDDDAELYQRDRALRASTWDEAAFARAFRHDIARVEGNVRIHYVIGGEGPVVVLLHGNPQSWREWRFIMLPLVEAGYRVVAPDLRGFGDSDKPLQGYDAKTVSEDIRQLVAQLGLKQVIVVGHDAGVGAAYAWAASYPDEVRALALIEAIPAGLEPPSGGVPKKRGKALWHPGFMMTPDLPEVLLAGRERVMLEYFFRDGGYDQTVFSEEDIEAYLRTYAAAGGVRGACSHYRAHSQSIALNKEFSKHKLPMPLLAIGGAESYGTTVEEAARQFAEIVRGAVPERTGHWVPEERPVWLLRQLTAFFVEDTVQASPLTNIGP